MSQKSNIKITVLFALSVGLIVAAITTCFLTIYYRQVCFHILGGFCDSMIEKNPDSRQDVLEILKTQDFHMTGQNILPNKFDNHVISNFGYYPSNLGHLSMIFDAKWQNFCVRKNTYANAGISTRFLTVSPAAMISLP